MSKANTLHSSLFRVCEAGHVLAATWEVCELDRQLKNVVTWFIDEHGKDEEQSPLIAPADLERDQQEWDSRHKTFQAAVGEALSMVSSARPAGLRFTARLEYALRSVKARGRIRPDELFTRTLDAILDDAWTLAEKDAADCELDDLVTLDQASAVVQQSKRTLERYLRQLPVPDFPGGNGRPHRWYWRTLRPHLERHFRPNLPTKFPGSRII